MVKIRVRKLGVFGKNEGDFSGEIFGDISAGEASDSRVGFDVGGAGRNESENFAGF